MVLYPLDWLEERSGLVGGIKYFLFRKVPGDLGWAHTLGSATLTAFLVQAITGVILAMFYKPSPDEAYESIQHITNDVDFGWLVRGMHRWGASVFIILLFFHMARVFLYGAYKYPRELNWIVGVFLLILGMFEGFTGYLLPYDQTAYWATVVGMNITANGPFVGTDARADHAGRSRDRGRHAGAVLLAAYARRAGPDLRADRAAPVPRDPARRQLAALVEGGRRPRGPRARAGEPRALRARHADHARAADAVTIRNPSAEPPVHAVPSTRATRRTSQKKGKPFFPYAMFHDTVMSLVVVLVIIGLACVWKWTTPGDHTGTGAGWLGPLFSDKADPGTTSFVPRPDWYFYFLFYLLRIFKWPDSVILGTVGIPTIIMVLMLALPFLDMRRERRLSRRPVAVVICILTVIAMGTLTYKGATAKEALASEVVGAVPSWVKKNNLPAAAVPGAKLFAQSGCLTCHTYLGTRLVEPRRARPERRGREEQGRPVPGQPPEVPVVREPGLADAVVRITRRRQPQEDRHLPRGVEGRQVAAMMCACASSSA